MNSNSDKKTQMQKKPNLAVALVPIIAMGLLLGIGYGVYKIPPQVLLISAAFRWVFLMIIPRRCLVAIRSAPLPVLNTPI